MNPNYENNGNNSSQQNQTRNQTRKVKDDHYAVISTIYHALKGYDTSCKYEQDARNAGNSELTDFFSQLQKEQLQLANRCKRFIKDWVNSESDESQRNATATSATGEKTTGMGMPNEMRDGANGMSSSMSDRIQ